MIIGIGTDIIEIEKIKKAISKNKKFINRVYSKKEIEYAIKNDIINYHSLAGMWAAKEAFAKATGLGFKGFFFRDIEILHNDFGQPYIFLNTKMVNFFDKKIHLSISHSDFTAIAYCIIEE